MSEDNSKMNCAEYKEAIAADPTEAFEGGSEHAAGCDDCRALRERYRSLDERIAVALAVEAPPLTLPELPAVDAAATVVDLPARRRSASVPTWFGIAAGIALAAYIGLLTLTSDTTNMTLAEQVIAHLDHEAGSRVVTDVAVPERTLESVVSKDVAAMDDGIGLITYARSCVINGKTIPHLVVQGREGPVTLLLLPDEPVDRAIPLEGQSINGVILPVGTGSVAIIGERGEKLDAIGNRVIDSVKWRI